MSILTKFRSLSFILRDLSEHLFVRAKIITKIVISQSLILVRIPILKLLKHNVKKTITGLENNNREDSNRHTGKQSS